MARAVFLLYAATAAAAVSAGFGERGYTYIYVFFFACCSQPCALPGHHRRWQAEVRTYAIAVRLSPSARRIFFFIRYDGHCVERRKKTTKKPRRAKSEISAAAYYNDKLLLLLLLLGRYIYKSFCSRNLRGICRSARSTAAKNGAKICAGVFFRKKRVFFFFLCLRFKYTVYRKRHGMGNRAAGTRGKNGFAGGKPAARRYTNYRDAISINRW